MLCFKNTVVEKALDLFVGLDDPGISDIPSFPKTSGLW
jgi:hypothetical protein